MAEINVKQLPGLIKGWMKRAIEFAALGVILCTVLAMYVIDLPLVRTLSLSQETGIGMAGLGFFYSKL